ncbi:hypothetical protein LWI29_026485 [Acer saccharum]|uniref:Uncharacterized protein n=1 Tax=Acer saccharum TaxID=4024 RepID=A0AA39RR66_ACESA|nr:hypothetical protein LWI29_026485 [Acer saccharum]
MCRRRLYFAGPAPRSETAGASPVAVVIGVIGDVDIVSMVKFTVGRVEEFIHASLSETEEGFVSSAKKSVMANRRGGSELMWKETEKRIGEDWSPSHSEAIGSEVDHFYLRFWRNLISL